MTSAALYSGIYAFRSGQGVVCRSILLPVMAGISVCRWHWQVSDISAGNEGMIQEAVAPLDIDGSILG